MNRRYYSYGGWGLLLLSLILFLVSVTETRYETGVARFKGKVIAKGLRAIRLSTYYGVTYRVTIEGRSLEREGDVGSQKAWDAIPIGSEVDVESVGVTPNETRMTLERVGNSAVYRWIAAAAALGGVVLLALRFRRKERL